MNFRKDSLIFIESQIILTLLSVLSFVIIPVLGIGTWGLFSIPVIVLTSINPFIYNEYIEIDEQGIRCYKSKTVLWEYEWSMISEIRRGSRYRLPTAEIYIKADSSTSNLPTNYFHLGKAAKKALAFYGITINI